MMKKLNKYLNPITRLGKRQYSFFFPFITITIVTIASEIYCYQIAKNPLAVGTYIIFLNVALITYFSFRDGILGGAVISTASILYYLYIISTRHYTGNQYRSGIETTVTLGIIYYMLSGTIGGLKQAIDKLIDRVTDEKNRLQTIIQQLPVGVLITDEKGVLVQRNRQIDAILGMKIPIGFVIGKDPLEIGLINGKPVVPSQSPLAKSLLSGKPIVGQEMVYHRNDGKTVYLQVSSSPIKNRSGKFIAAASIISDITEKRELEKRKDDFVNMASHELKTPITSMKLYLELLGRRMKDFTDEKAERTLTSITYQADRLQELVSDLLDVSRLQTGKLTFKKERFRIDELIKETVEDLQGTTTKHTIIYTSKAPILVFADKFRIYQVVTNLLTNAIKYSPAGAEIRLNAVRTGGKVTVSVKDVGIGIAKDQQSKIFDRLYQVTDDKEHTFPGLGMGLYISKEIIKRHRGRIWVESEKGKGSTFYFTLPIEQSKK